VVTTTADAPTIRLESEVKAVVRAMLARRLCPSARIRAIDHRPTSFPSTFAIEEIDVVLNEGELLRLMLKPAGQRGALARPRLPAALFLHDPQREIEVYQHLLTRLSDAGPPQLVSTVVDSTTERYWLLFERVVGTELHRVANLEGWREAVRWVATMHEALAPFASQPDAPGVARLLRYEQGLLRMWMTRALAVARGQVPRVSQESLRGLERLASRYDLVVERLLAMPVTVIHGELGGSNVLLCRDVYPARVCVLDWEMAALGPALIDLAGLLSGQPDEARRREIALTYRAAVPAKILGSADERSFFEDLAFCRLHLAIQWLGFSPDPPPRRQANDWIAEVLRITDELGI
jgi:aminoglycoside phosphotransferase (APT) family kinase protein